MRIVGLYYKRHDVVKIKDEERAKKKPIVVEKYERSARASDINDGISIGKNSEQKGHAASEQT